MMKFAKKEIKPAQKKEEQSTAPKKFPEANREQIIIPKLTPPPAKQATKAPRPLPAVKNPPSQNPHNNTALPAPQISDAPGASAPPETGQSQNPFAYASAPQQTGEFTYGHYAPPPTYEGQPGGVPAFNPYIPNAPPMSENPAVKQPAPVAFGFAPPSQLPAEDPNAKGEDGKTPLHRAVLAENRPEVERLLQLPGIDLTIADKDGSTALHYAAEIGSKNIANVLIEKNKALLGMKNLKGETPLAIAKAKGHGYMADMLNLDSLFPADPFGSPFAAVLPAQPMAAASMFPFDSIGSPGYGGKGGMQMSPLASASPYATSNYGSPMLPFPAQPGMPGMGMPGMGTPGMGTPGMGMQGMGTPGMGMPGMGTPGMGTPFANPFPGGMGNNMMPAQPTPPTPYFGVTTNYDHILRSDSRFGKGIIPFK